MATPEQVAAVIEPIAPPAPVPKKAKAKKKTTPPAEEVKEEKPVILDLTEPHDEQPRDDDPPLFVSEDGAVHYADYDSDDDDSSSGGYTLWNMAAAFLSGTVTGAGLLAAAIGYLSALEEKKMMEQYNAQMDEAKRRGREFIDQQAKEERSELEEKPQP